MSESWYGQWKAFMQTKRHYPDTGTHTTADGTATIRSSSVTPHQSASALPGNLKRLMDAQCWTVGRPSEASGVNRSTIRNVLKADKAHNHTLDVILRLAEALEVGIERLVEDREP